MKQTTCSILLIAVASLTLLLHPPELLAHREYVHQYLAIEAYRLLLQRHPGLSSTEFASHIGAQAGDCQGFPFTLATVTAGAYREDCEDPVFHYGDVIGGLDNAYFSASHFWDADAGDVSTIEICDVSCGRYRNAYQKTLRYVLPGVYGRWTAKLTWPAGSSSFYLQGGGTTTIFHNGLIGFEYDSLAAFFRDGTCTITGYIDITGKWQTSATVPDQLPRKVVAPKAVRDRIGWEVVGRIAHLLGDMGVPAHTHNDIHPPFWWNNEPADVYEEEMSRRYTAWTHEDALAQGGLLDFRGALQAGSVERVMRYLVYTTNQVADRFPSNDADGDDRYDVEWDGDDYSVLEIIREIGADPRARNVFHQEAAEYAFVYSIRSIAGLLDWFAQETGILARVTVDADFPGASVFVDGKPRATPALPTFPAGTRFTIEAGDQPGIDSVTGTLVTMKFNSWIRTDPSRGDTRLAEPRLTETAVDGRRYLARFDRVVTIDLAEARHLDGGTGGRYSVNGADVGGGWTGVVNTGTTPAITVGFTPPPGSVFLAWSDGATMNPREVRPSGNLELRSLCKRRLTSTLSPEARPANQRRIARAVAPEEAGFAVVMTYESAGDVFVSRSADGLSWSAEEMVSDGRGNARDPSIDDFAAADGAETVVAWEERLPGGAGRRVLARTMGRGARAWSAPFVVDDDSSAAGIRATPALSADLVVWRGPAGILCRRLSAGGTFTVPGTGPASTAPVADVYSYAEGKFAVGWIDGVSRAAFVRGNFAGPSWGVPRTAGTATAPDEIRSLDIALSAGGNGGVAWMTSSGGDWKFNYRVFDPADVFQPTGALQACPAGGGPQPSLRLTHHRHDGAAPKDIGVHAWNARTGALATLLLKSGQKIGPSVTFPEAGYPEIPGSAISGSGVTPALVATPVGGPYWALAPAALRLGPALPAVPSTVAPPAGATGLGPNVTLSWSCAADASSFGLQLSRNESFSGPLVADRSALTGTSLTVQNLDPAAVYYWRVRSVNSLGSGSYGQAQSFSTASPPPAPALSGSVITAPKGSFPKLSWSAVAGADSYRLYRYLCTDPPDCSPVTSRPAIIYEGPLTTFTDGGVQVSPKAPSGVACYYVAGKTAGFTGPASNTISFPMQANMVWSADPSLPESSGLTDNYPNPFNPSTTIAYRVADPGRVTIAAFNILAQKVATLFDATQEPGFHELLWDASALPAGIYVVVMELSPANGARGIVDRKKVLLLK